ncbi:MAG: penicillin-binding protein 2 [Patescibacteria group bacterium]|nr:penicillin-binding protein 2 [Patescibacteria group bacterium]
MFSSLRANLIFSFFALLTFFFIAKLYILQIKDHGKYKALAKSQHQSSLVLNAKRGNIYTSDNYPLALTETRYLLYAEPKKIENPTKYAKSIADILEEDSDKRVELELSIKENLLADLFWVPLKKNLTAKQKQKVESLNLEGLGFEEEFVRFYPENTLASHILGFVGSDKEGAPAGYFGVEGYYEGELKGVAGIIFQEKDAFGYPIAVGDYKKIPPQNGRSLVLTVDRALQFVIEGRLKDSVEKYGAKSATAIVVEPQTGKIRAMANFPNEGKDITDESTRNKAIADTYEPGSVVKALTMSSAIDMGKVTPETTYVDDGPKSFSGHIVDTWDGKHYGVETMTSVLQHSNNLGAAWVGGVVGAKNLRDYFIKFGFGNKLGIDLEGEDTGIIRELSEWRDIDLAVASFGQGISVTPLQVVMAFSAIANDGVLMKPFVVERIMDDSGEEIAKFAPTSLRKVISKKSADTMVEMLTAAVSGGEAKFFVSKKYIVAGKTGTAQIPVSGSYDPNKTNATFVGFLPISKKFVMLIKLEEPKASVYASETAVPVWMDIAETIAIYYKIPPDK